MKTRKVLVRFGILIAPVVAALSMASPPVSMAAAPTILIDGDIFATSCGKYDGKPAMQDALTVISGAASGSTIIICPGDYILSAPITITGKKMTIKRAVTGEDSRPALKTIDGATGALFISDGSSVTIDGLLIDTTGTTLNSIYGIIIGDSSATINNLVFYGGSMTSLAVLSYVSDSSAPQKLTVKNCWIDGYASYGIGAQGQVTLSASGCTLDGDPGTGLEPTSIGLVLGSLSTAGTRTATGTISNNRIINNVFGIALVDTTKASVANNTLIGNKTGVYMTASTVHPALDGNKITGNSILSVPDDGVGIFLENNHADVTTLKIAISKNLIVAAQPDPLSTTMFAIHVHANVPALTTLIATITGNTIMGFSEAQRVSNDSDNAGLIITKNDAAP